jgi:hypothetical protein
MLDQIPTVGRGYPSLHGLDETCFVLEIEIQNFLRQRIRVAPLPRGQFGKLGFLLGSEMHFHVSECR